MAAASALAALNGVRAHGSFILEIDETGNGSLVKTSAQHQFSGPGEV